MSKALQEQIDKLFEATKELLSFEEIEPHCETFNEYANNAYTRKTLGTMLSRYGFYKKFATVKLEQGKNADSVPKYDDKGNVKGYELKHYAVLLCALTKDEWKKRNETTRVTDRVTSEDSEGFKGQEVEPEAYIEVTRKLLESSNPHELAVGLIAATGRRPHEILARAKFTPIEGKEYEVKFEGQGKKRGEVLVFPISTIFPSGYLIKCLAKLRQDASIKSLIKEVSTEFPDDLALQNRNIENRRGNSLRRVVQEFFGGRDHKEPLLNFRLDKNRNDCKALRAAYGALVTDRDCKGSIGAKIYFYSLMLGHITPEERATDKDKDLMKLATSIGYADYYVTKPIPFPQILVKAKVEKAMQVRVTPEDFTFIKDLQDKWELPNQQTVVTQLIKKADEVEHLKRQIMEAQAQINDLQNQLEEKSTMEAQPQIQAFDKNLLREMMVEILAELQSTTPQPQPPTVTLPSTPTVRKPKPELDYESMGNDELKKLRSDGAVDEKIRRAFVAITDFNDAQPSNQTRWAITNQSLRQVSGCNGQKVKEWMERYQASLNDHNAKYGLGQYHNKGKGDITCTIKW
jgi:hypothetical protein